MFHFPENRDQRECSALLPLLQDVLRLEATMKAIRQSAVEGRKTRSNFRSSDRAWPAPQLLVRLLQRGGGRILDNHLNGRAFASTSAGTADRGIVEQIAALPSREGEKRRMSISFGSKFCHFLVNPIRFPIYDDAAREAIRLHLGAKAYVAKKTNRYLDFCEKFETLRKLAKLKCETKELDRYLWLTGMYMRWLKEKSKKNPRVNAELKELFQRASPAIAADMKAMLPPPLNAPESFTRSLT